MRTTVIFAAAALCVLGVASVAGGYSNPRFQPVSIAFFDHQHGLVAEDDWTCKKMHGCQGRVLATSDGGVHWNVTYVGARGFHLYAVRGTEIVFARTGDAMLRSSDRGLHWQPLSWPPSIVSFISALQGWKLAPQTRLAQPPALEQTQDGGRSWTARVDPCDGDFGLVAALSFASPSRGWIVCTTQRQPAFKERLSGRHTTAARNGNLKVECIRSGRLIRS